jgi:uncharacterized protein (DUF305 family)
VTDTQVGSTLERGSATEDGPARRPRPGVPFLPAIFLAAALLFAGYAAGTWWANRTALPSQVDIGFYDDMSSHHQQAVDMARIYERYGDNDSLRSRAQEIETSQIGDIRVMQYALAKWNETGTPNVAMQWMGESVPQDAMPGMATPAEMQELAAARGLQLDDLFTALMINHHAGGLHMAQHAAETARLSETRSVANAMAKTQQMEIDELNHARQDLGLPIHQPSTD